jgi:hypothetical protein
LETEAKLELFKQQAQRDAERSNPLNTQLTSNFRYPRHREEHSPRELEVDGEDCVLAVLAGLPQAREAAAAGGKQAGEESIHALTRGC